MMKNRYRNNGLIASYSKKFSDKFELKSNARFAETYLQYDAACVSNLLVVRLIMITPKNQMG